MNKQTEEKENVFFKSEGRTICSLATDVKEIFDGGGLVTRCPGLGITPREVN